MEFCDTHILAYGPHRAWSATQVTALAKIASVLERNTALELRVAQLEARAGGNGSAGGSAGGSVPPMVPYAPAPAPAYAPPGVGGWQPPAQASYVPPPASAPLYPGEGSPVAADPDLEARLAALRSGQN
jgi:hypothetical protein